MITIKIIHITVVLKLDTFRRWGDMNKDISGSKNVKIFMHVSILDIKTMILIMDMDDSFFSATF